MDITSSATGDGMTASRKTARLDALALLVGRVAMAALFVPSGFGKLTHLDGFAQSLGVKGLPMPIVWAALGAASEFFGGLAIALGFKTRYAALLMVAFTIMASLLSHRFWELQEAARQLQYVNFMKNLAIIGGFLVLYARGAGPLSLDRSP